MIKITDIHTHVLPGVDDGAADWEVCRQMLLKSTESGVTGIIATPHYLPWKRKGSGKDIIRLCGEIQQRFKVETGITLDIYPGNEIYYHVDMVESLKKGDALTLAGSRYVLVEFSTEESYNIIMRAVQNLRSAGYIPIIAHVERYKCLRKNGRLGTLSDVGAKLQMNVEVLQMGIFNEIGRWAKKALLNEQIHFLATDMHNLTSRLPLKEEQLLWIRKRLPRGYQEDILYNNSMKILSGREKEIYGK